MWRNSIETHSRRPTVEVEQSVEPLPSLDPPVRIRGAAAYMPPISSFGPEPQSGPEHPRLSRLTDRPRTLCDLIGN